MSLNNTPSANRLHIGIFGKRNAGKSSIINGITGQNLAIVSDVKGTTTDPVLKAMEILPLGPVVIIDTPGLDDEGELGTLRMQKAYQILNKTDVAVLIVDGTIGFTAEDDAIFTRIKQKNIPYVIVFNKQDLTNDSHIANIDTANLCPYIWVSAHSAEQMYELKELIAAQVPADDAEVPIIRDLVEKNDFVLLVMPIDSAAPKGRLILPQQQTVRDLLDVNAVSIVVQDTEVAETLAALEGSKKPKLVVTDSQAFEKVSQDVPDDILLTSFSILFARHKGNLWSQVEGAKAIDNLQEGDTILISEGCTHHRQCDDIGTIKLPRWIKKFTGNGVNIEFTSGTEFPLDLSKYKLIIHCGGCVLNEREMRYRVKCAADAGVPMTNYGTAIAHMHGVLDRALKVFQ
ncbi:MAG: [FeFe] hydrogenase H-cluster maturation GTPase HydF [Eubacteriales bacterium]